MSTQIDPRLQYGQVPSTAFAANLDRASRISGLPPLASADAIDHTRTTSNSALQPAPYYHRLPPAPLDHSPTYATFQAPLEHTKVAADPLQDQYSGGEDASPASGINQDPHDQKRSRACEACRSLKVRCDQDSNFPEQPCKRCSKAKRECVISAPSRKRQKKNDTRVAELEKKIDALTASLHAQGKELPFVVGDGQDVPHRSPSERKYSTSTEQPSASPREAHSGKDSFTGSSERPASTTQGSTHPYVEAQALPKTGKRRHSNDNQGTSAKQRSKPPDSSHTDGDADKLDIRTRLGRQIEDIIDKQAAARIFDRYVSEMAIHLPAVVFPSGTTAKEIRSSKPILFLSILVAASVGMAEIRVQEGLAQLLMSVFADCVIRNGEKSLELIQALQISTIWYRPPKRYEQMNFYQLSHIAVVMAIDIGMGKRNPPRNWRKQNEQMRAPKLLLNPDTVEARRTWLGCYFSCANTSMTLRRPNLIRWTTYMDECIEVLESSPSALPSDKLLCQHVKLQHINEDIGLQFSMDDPSATITISDSRVQYALKAFERQLREWKTDVPSSVWNSALHNSEYVTSLYMHEVAMHINHNVDDFRAPFTEESLKAASGQSDVLSPAHSAALVECMTSVHGIFRTFFQFDLVMIRALPIFYFVRIAYAVVVLIKLYFAVCAPGSEVAKIFSKEDLKVETHLDSLLKLFHSINNENAFRPANKFLMILGKLREWFRKNKDTKSSVPREAAKLNPWAAGNDGERRGTSPYTMQPPAYQQHPRLQQQQSQQANDRKGNSTAAIPQQLRYSNTPSTPLHFLSEVATTQDMPMQGQQQSLQQQHPQTQPTSWYQNTGIPIPDQTVPSSGLDMSYGGIFDHGASIMGHGFDQAMDMTLGTADGDLSSLFMGDPMFNFGGGLDGMDGLGDSYYGMGDVGGRW